MLKNSFIILLVLFGVTVFGQTTEKNNPLITERKPRNFITLSILNISVENYKFGYQYYVPKKNYAFGINFLASAPINNSFLDEFTRQTFGVDIDNKFFFKSLENVVNGDNRYYFNLGLRYQYIALQYEAEVWTPFVEDGIEYYKLAPKTFKPSMNRFAFVPQIGLEKQYNSVLFDFHLGINLFSDQIKGNIRNADLPKSRWKERTLPPANSRIVIGFKVGFLLGK